MTEKEFINGYICDYMSTGSCFDFEANEDQIVGDLVAIERFLRFSGQQKMFDVIDIETPHKIYKELKKRIEQACEDACDNGHG